MLVIVFRFRNVQSTGFSLRLQSMHSEIEIIGCEERERRPEIGQTKKIEILFLNVRPSFKCCLSTHSLYSVISFMWKRANMCEYFAVTYPALVMKANTKPPRQASTCTPILYFLPSYKTMKKWNNTIFVWQVQHNDFLYLYL